jgi:hypothetical protein
MEKKKTTVLGVSNAGEHTLFAYYLFHSLFSFFQRLYLKTSAPAPFFPYSADSSDLSFMNLFSCELRHELVAAFRNV